MIWPFHKHKWEEVERQSGRTGPPGSIVPLYGLTALYVGPITIIRFKCSLDITHFKTIIMPGAPE